MCGHHAPHAYGVCYDMLVLVCMSAPQGHNHIHKQGRIDRYCLSCMLAVPWTWIIGRQQSPSLSLDHGAWNDVMEHCMPFKMSVFKETSISVSYDHLIQDCTTGWYEYNCHMHAKHRYIYTLSFLIFFSLQHTKDKNEIKTYNKPRCTQMLDSASHSNNTRVLNRLCKHWKKKLSYKSSMNRSFYISTSRNCH